MNRRKSLIETNPYLKDPKKRAELIKMSVLTSSAVEGIYVNIKPLTMIHEQSQKSGKNKSTTN